MASRLGTQPIEQPGIARRRTTMRPQEPQSGRVFREKGLGRTFQFPVALLDFASLGFCVIMHGRVVQLTRTRR
jgi:hypothetical protein